MIDLDEPSSLAPDVSGMLRHVRALGPELLRAWDSCEELVNLQFPAPPSAVVVAGMGGSATAGDYFATLCAPVSAIPVTVARGTLPAFVSSSALVIVSSYSGNTSESLACYAEARARGATVIAITRGGELEERARHDGVPIVRIAYQSPPRAAVPHTLAPLLRIGALLHLCEVDDTLVRTTSLVSAEYSADHLAPAVPESRNRAKACAHELRGHTPIIIGAEHLGPAAIRFKNQLAENGKTLAAAELLPEAAHNFVVGLQTARNEAARLSVVMLDSTLYAPANRRLAKEMRALFERAEIHVRCIQVPGDDVLTQAWTATAFADFTSCYVALLQGLDPTPIPEIEQMRAITGQ